MDALQTGNGSPALKWISDACDRIEADGTVVSAFVVQTKVSPVDRRWTDAVSIPRVPSDEPADLMSRIQAEADGLDCPRVRVVARYPKGKIPISTRIWETPFAEDDSDIPGSGGDAINAAYVQTLRHNEVLIQRLVTTMDSHTRQIAEQNKMLVAQQSQLLKERVEITEQQRALILEGARADAETEQNNAVSEGIRMLIATSAHYLTKGSSAPDAKFDTLVSLLKSVSDSLTEEQAAKLSEILTPKQLTALSSVLSEPEAKVEQLEKHREQKRNAKTEG